MKKKKKKKKQQEKKRNNKKKKKQQDKQEKKDTELDNDKSLILKKGLIVCRSKEDGILFLQTKLIFNKS